MAKIVIQCPDCGRYVELNTGLFAKKKTKCVCGRVIDANADRLAFKTCPHCGNEVSYDQMQGEAALCPVCHERLVTAESLSATVSFTCPSCSGKLTANKKETECSCKYCGCHIDIAKRVAQEALRADGTASVIKWEAEGDILVWKHPIENFNLGSQLIVYESQEALFFRDGKAYQPLGAGRHLLTREMMDEFGIKEEVSGVEPVVASVSSEVYFINKSTQIGIKWGTPSRVRIIEPASGLPIQIGARGSFNLTVSDSRKLINSMVSGASGFAQGGQTEYSAEYMRDKFADLVAMNVSAYLARVITENGLNVLTLDTKKPEISRILGNAVNDGLFDFGLSVPEGQFYVTDIMLPEDDPEFRRLKQQYVSSALDIRDQEIAAAKLKASLGRVEAESQLEIARAKADQARILIEEETDSKVRLQQARLEADEMRITAGGMADSVKIAATGASDSVILSAKGAAERIRLEGQASADAYRAQAMAEAEGMKAKGYSYGDETARQVGTELAKNTFISASVDLNDGAWSCDCGKSGITSRFCPSCGKRKPAPQSAPTGWSCTCGCSNITSNFCPDCGAKKPTAPVSRICPSCGEKNITSKFCPNCGQKLDC